MADQDLQPSTYYVLLKLAPWASAQDIRRAYRELSKQYHPDTTTLPEAIATTKFQQLNEAYSTLSNPEKRAKYDLNHGYSRFSGVTSPDQSYSPQVFNPPKQSSRPHSYPKNLYLDPNDRPLSPGEIFAVLLLGLTFIGCIAIVLLASLFKGDIAISLTAWLGP
ncbi:MAG: J domain-containing protein [Merismopedia sp. SIO2A8]|nr:J domain-containing protein [Symploca sp. SIO2B6]NET50238.1 J domain-containing protein [Merismopedia sp. SIO2A8]